MSSSQPTDSPQSASASSFFANVLTPGSSLHPTFLLLVDAAFGTLLLVLTLLALATSGNVHLIALIAIELALWASVKWFVHELQKVQAHENANSGSVGKTKSEKSKED